MTRFRRAAALASLMLVAAALPLALLAQGGRFSAGLDVLTHFAPAYLAGSLLAGGLAAWAARRRRPALLAASALAVLASGALIAPEFRPPPAIHAAPGGAPIKLVQFNAWGGNARPDAAAAWILAQSPDIVVLQEGARVASRLRSAGYHGRACRDCGSIILTRRPPVAVHEAPPERGVRTFLASATVEDAYGPYVVVGIHRYWPVRREFARQQTAALRRLMRSHPAERLILAGDFNSTPWSFARRREDEAFGLIRRTRALFTWPAARVSHNRAPAPFPYMPIDHVYAGPGWATVKVERGPELGSDHYPVIVTLAPAQGAAR